ncbi:MAG: copper amine oxidase N-terminal domain-containing protein [Armatimonadota bacterium]
MMRAAGAIKGTSVPTAVILLLIAQGGVLGQSIIINDVRLVTTRNPVTVRGSILLPMRDVFQALQAQVNWFPAERRITAIRGRTTIELRLGRTRAMIDGRPVELSVPPTLIRGTTYIPLRFPTEAFGGSVVWRPATRTVLITIPPPGEPAIALRPPQSPLPPASPTRPPVQTPIRTPDQAIRVEGTLVQVIAAPSSIVMSVSGSGLAQAITFGPRTAISRHVQGQPPQPARLADAVPGDCALAVIAPDGIAQSVDFTYGEVEGTVAGISDNSILLKDNTVYTLSPTAAVLDRAGRKIALWDLPQNVPVKLRYDPTSRIVYEVRWLTPAQLPPTITKPSIMLIGLNGNPVVKAGEVLRVQLQGTAGGTATATLGNIFRDLALTEVDPGIYEGEFTVRGGTNERNLPLEGNLLVNGVPAKPASTLTGVTIDTIPPAITGISPGEGAAVSNADAVIEAAFDAGGGAPINPASVTLSLDGALVRGGTVTAQRLGYQAQDLPQGQIRAEINVEDMAGNRATRSWTFFVMAAGRPLFSLGHDGRGTLVAGGILRVSMRARKPGGVATFDLGNFERGLPMPRVGTGDTYRGQYVVQPGGRLSDGVITVHYRDPDGVETSARLTERVSIDATVPTALDITSPAKGSQVADTIWLAGKAPPHTRVRLTITYRLLNSVSGRLWQGIVTANSAGAWEAPAVGSKIGMFRKADEYLVNAEQLDAADEVVRARQIGLVK